MTGEKGFVTLSPNMDESLEYYFSPVDSLLTLSIKAVAMDVGIDKNTLSLLPSQLKNKILRVTCKRGNLTLDMLDALLTPDISELDLSEYVVTDEHLKVISNRCKQLSVLNMNRGRYQKHLFSSEEIIKLLPNLPLLTTFYAEGTSSITDDVVESLVANCPRLGALDLGGCPLTDKAAASLANLKYLQSLNISSTQITDEGIFYLTNGICKFNLYEIKLNNCHKLTNRAINCVVDNCPKIKILVFHGCPLITGDCEQVLTCLLSRCNVSHITYTVY
ncbi:protein AMN1 homolog [Lycorma delicatula]|uniref:protein AMN1 homolog n=1 Tax=Lycorma delicatula TaxID=130591 RepID=UPI003F51A24D